MFQNLRRELEFLELPPDADLLTDAEIESWANEIATTQMGIKLQTASAITIVLSTALSPD